MNNADFEVIQAQIALDAAKQRAAANLTAEQKKTLHEVRGRIREATTRYNSMAADIRDERELRNILQKRIENLQQMLDASWAERPRAADYLDADPECTEWLQKHGALEQQRDRLIAQRDSVPSTDLIEALRLQNAITALQYEERALLAQLDGSLARNLEGSIGPLR